MRGRGELFNGFACFLILDVSIMHSPVYLAICAASLGGMLVFGTPELTNMVLAVAMAIAVLGVPHGGLDHWAGRRLLRRWFANGWWAVFFPSYLLIGMSFAWGWFVAPTFTVVLFFVISAWHFGREDHQTHDRGAWNSRSRVAFEHVAAAAVGGLVIWIPAIFRPDEMRLLLRMIVPETGGEPIRRIVEATQMVAGCLVPLAMAVVTLRLLAAPADWVRWVPLATVTVGMGMPILVSFSIYFCGWHSWQGLQRLRRQEAMTTSEFIRRVAPLSTIAIIGVAVAGWWLQEWTVELQVDGQASAGLRTVFIGLSAIAVPHLFLHELDSRLAQSRPNVQGYA